MIEIIPENRKKTFAQKLNIGLGRGLEMGQRLMQDYENKSRLAKQKQALSQLTGMDLSDIDDPEILNLLTSHALKSQQQQQQFEQQFSDQMNAQNSQNEMDMMNYEKIKGMFGDKFADIWKLAPTGGKTELLKTAIESRLRGEDINKVFSEMSPENFLQNDQMNPGFAQEMGFEDVGDANNFQKDFSKYLNEKDRGVLPEEKIARGKERYSTGLEKYQEAGTRLRGLNRDKDRIGILESLEKTKKLPEDLARLNVDAEGNLKFAFAASPEAQRFVKTLNEFSEGAKDTFGSRVTNFDLSQYLKRYPTLLNSAEGRRQLYQQMKIVNDINSVYYKNLKKVYDMAGGVRNIDADVAERFAEQISEKKISELSKKFMDIGEFSSKPNASEFSGKKIRDKDTGEIFISNGTDWVPAE